MAFPTVEAVEPDTDNASGGAAPTGSTAATSHSLTLPLTVSAGALLMIVGRVTVAGTVAITDWTVNQDSSDGSDDVTFWAYKNALAVGTEDGTSVTCTHGNGKIAAMSFSITGAEDPATQPPEASTVATGASTAPDPTTCTPTGGAKDYLWIWFGGWEGEQTLGKTAATNYTADDRDISTGTAGAITTNCQIKAGDRQSNAASEDPAGVTLSASDDWTAWTIAVHPAGAVTQITLNDSGAAADSLSVAAAVTLTDSGTAADTLTVDTGTTAVTLADAGAAADSLQVTAAVPLAEQGTAADQVTVAVAAPLAEQGTAADTLTVQLPAGTLGGALLGTPGFQPGDVQLGTILVAAGGTPKDLADVGAGADSLTVAVAAPLAEVGAAADTVTVAAQVTLNDSGVASDSIAAGIFKVLAEQGTAADTLTVTVAAPLAEQGSGTDAVSVSASVPLTDQGAASDTVAAAVPAVLADAGTASDSLTVTVAAPLAEQGTAADTVGVAAQITLGTVGAAADTVSVGVAVAKTLTDQGAAADSVAVGAAVPLAEFAAAADALAVQALLALAEQGAAADTVSVLDVAATPGTLTVASAPLALIATSDVGALLAAGTSRIGGPA